MKIIVTSVVFCLSYWKINSTILILKLNKVICFEDDLICKLFIGIELAPMHKQVEIFVISFQEKIYVLFLSDQRV